MRRSNPARLAALLSLAITLALPSAARADAVTDWNALMQGAVSVMPGSNPNYQARWAAIVQLAVFEAVNAITGDYEPYLGDIAAPSWASPEAAAIVAAHDTLVALRPGSAAVLDPERDADLAAIPDGPEKEAGIIVGEDAAAAMLLLRVDDGWDDVVPYTPGTNPGDFQPPPSGAFLPHWGQVTPFGIEDGSQFHLPAPPALHTGNYAHDYNEVKRLGKIDSPFRPQDRTDVARFYALTSPVNVFNPAVRQVSAAQELTLSENARVFALLAMAMADASIACWDTKYEDNFWRPQTAIRNGDLDGNKHTDKDASWTPLIATPAHPSYASGHATLCNAARAVLEQVFGKDGHAIVLSNPALPDVVLAYTDWDEMTDDVDDARIYGGIHFRFDQDAGARQGRHVGRYILRNYLRAH
jgi:hypothetical protein